MAHRVFLLSLFMILLLQQHSQLVAASRSLMFHPPAIPRASLMRKPVSPPAIDFDWFSKNHYRTLEEDAFRPTSPGHSSGVGHNQPPGY
ncbi:hypothetical protein SLE2022_223480 [Rubroshorea leprosula]